MSAHFFEELDAILGSRAASEPPLVLDSASGPSSFQDIEDGLISSVVVLYPFYVILLFR